MNQETNFIEIISNCSKGFLFELRERFNDYPIPMHPVDARISQHIDDEIEQRQVEGKL